MVTEFQTLSIGPCIPVTTLTIAVTADRPVLAAQRCAGEPTAAL